MRRATTFLISTLSRNAGVSQASKACNAVEILGSDSCNAPAAMFSSAASFGPLAHMASMQLEQQVQAVTSGLRNTGRLSLDTDAFWRNTRGQRCFSSGTNTEQGKPDQAASEGQASSGGSSTEGADASQNQASDDSSSSQTSAEELLNEIKAKEEAMTKLTGQVCKARAWPF